MLLVTEDTNNGQYKWWKQQPSSVFSFNWSTKQAGLCQESISVVGCCCDTGRSLLSSVGSPGWRCLIQSTPQNIQYPCFYSGGNMFLETSCICSVVYLRGLNNIYSHAARALFCPAQNRNRTFSKMTSTIALVSVNLTGECIMWTQKKHNKKHKKKQQW